MKSIIYSIIFAAALILTLNCSNVKSEKEKVEQIATEYLSSAASQERFPSGFIAKESLEKAKELNLTMLLSFDSTETVATADLLFAEKARLMTGAELWDYMNQKYPTVKNLDLNIEWKIVKTMVENDDAFVTYKIKDRGEKVLKLMKEDNRWKVVLSFASIF